MESDLGVTAVALDFACHTLGVEEVACLDEEGGVLGDLDSVTQGGLELDLEHLLLCSDIVAYTLDTDIVGLLVEKPPCQNEKNDKDHNDKVVWLLTNLRRKGTKKIPNTQTFLLLFAKIFAHVKKKQYFCSRNTILAI